MALGTFRRLAVMSASFALFVLDVVYKSLLQGGSFFMKTLIGGAVAAVLGLIGLSVWFGELMQLLAGSIPVMMLVGGALALYLGFDELKDTWKTDSTGNGEGELGIESTDNYKSEIEKLKGEIETLKSEKS